MTSWWWRGAVLCRRCRGGVRRMPCRTAVRSTWLVVCSLLERRPVRQFTRGCGAALPLVRSVGACAGREQECGGTRPMLVCTLPKPGRGGGCLGGVPVAAAFVYAPEPLPAVPARRDLQHTRHQSLAALHAPVFMWMWRRRQETSPSG